MGLFHPWEIISAVEVAYFVLILAAAIYPAFTLIKEHKKFRMFYIRYSLLLLTKIIGGILTIAFIHNVDNTDLAIAASVLNVIGLGFITMLVIFCIKFVDTYKDADSGKKKGPKLKNPLISLIKQDYTKSKSWELLLEKIVFACIIINAVGSSYISSDRSLAKQLMEAGSILYIGSLVIIAGLLFNRFRKSDKESSVVRRFELLILTLLAICIPILLIRMVYSICGAFTFNVNGTYTTHVSRFSFLFGDWKLYAFVGFIEECICSLLLLFVTFVVLNHHNKEKSQLPYSQHSVDDDSKGEDIDV